MDVFDSISALKGVGAKKTQILNKAGIYTVYDLLSHYPREYLDPSLAYGIGSAPLNENVCVRAYVGSVAREHYIRKGMTTYSFDIIDGRDAMDVIFFNNKYVTGMLKNGEEYLFYGKIKQLSPYYKSMTAPRFIRVSESEGLSPVYSQIADINSSQVEKLVASALESVNTLPDCLPESVKNDYCLMTCDAAVRNIHFPSSRDYLAEAKRRIAFEELFLLQVGLSRLKIKSKKTTAYSLQRDFAPEFCGLLPFELTGAQKKAIAECTADMSSGVPMNRLLQGDVGSGKTAVSAALVYNAVKNGFQAAVMAPTEVLARQHFNTFTKFFENTGIRTALLTGSVTAKEKREIKERLACGETDLIIGTHAIIQKDVVFKNLGLAITDEQHRFGVNQRGALGSKGKNPHTLVMSATPIPRTLSLIIYGDLDISILDEMPAGRQKTDTFVIDFDKRERAYGYVKKHILSGYQGYIVCPLVDFDEEEEPDSERKASVKLYEELSTGFFKGFRLGLLYGKMKAEEKKEVMTQFAAGNIDLLISTTVIEVGVDVPNAVIMVIENADCFGLSQLHQLRGRVGRGDVKSTCILISDIKNDEVKDRLKILEATSDGFRIADEDLKLRGPGDFIGSRQHGLPDLKLSKLLTDSETVRETHFAAENLLKNNPALEGEEYNMLKKRVNQMFSKGLVLN